MKGLNRWGHSSAADSVPACRTRLERVHLLTAASMLRTALQTDPDSYRRYAPVAGTVEMGARPGWTPDALARWRTLAIAATIAWAGRPRSALTGLASVGSSVMFQRSVIDFHRPLWNYNSHIVALLGFEFLGFRAGPGREDHAPEALRAMELFVGFIYLQSAAAKAKHGGPAWVTSAPTIRVALSELGREPLASRLHGAGIERVVAAATVALETATLPIVAFCRSPRQRRTLALALSSFHGGLKATIDISFWHLWSHALALLVPEPCSCNRCHR